MEILDTFDCTSQTLIMCTSTDIAMNIILPCYHGVHVNYRHMTSFISQRPVSLFFTCLVREAADGNLSTSAGWKYDLRRWVGELPGELPLE